jgi:hypothetical protein
MVSPEFVRHLLEEHERGRRNNYHTLWSLLMLELWFRDLEQPHALPEMEGIAAAALQHQ